MQSINHKRIIGLMIFISGIALNGCSQKELKNFARQTAHNVGCDQSYENHHRERELKDDCMRNRPQ